MARKDGWTHEQFLAACLEREVTAHGGELRVKVARFPARKSLEDFDFAHASRLKRDQVSHLGTPDFVVAKDNVILLGHPGTGKTHLVTALAIKACHAGHRVLFAAAADWVNRLAEAHHAGWFPDEIKRLGPTPCWSSTKSATCPSNLRPRTCSSSSSPPATNGPPSSSPGTSPSAAGAKSWD